MDTATIIFLASILVIFFMRLPLAVLFFNREYSADKGIFDYSRAEHVVMLFYWYTATKKENRTLARILNMILLVVGAIFLGTIIYSEIMKYKGM